MSSILQVMPSWGLQDCHSWGPHKSNRDKCNVLLLDGQVLGQAGVAWLGSSSAGGAWGSWLALG